VIDYKLREEKQGGYLLDRRAGSARPLSPGEFGLMRDLARPDRRFPLDLVPAIARYFPDDPAAGWAWWQDLEKRKLTTAEGLQTLHFIPLEGEAVADDCLAAPARLYFELTRRCNLACRTCFNNSRQPLSEELTTPEILDLLDQLHRLGTFEIRFTGGEPTEHLDFREIVAFARSCGFYLSLGTNGVYTEEKRSWIFDCGVDWFILSLDGTEEVNDRVRGAGTYREVVRTLQDLAARPELRVRLNMVVARHNVHTIEALADLADEYGVHSLNLIPLRPYGRSVKQMSREMFGQRDFYEFIQLINRLRPRHRVQFSTTLDLLDPEATTSHDPIVQKRRTCAAGVEATVIGPTGDVYGCSYSPASFPDSDDVEGRKLFVAGNIRQDPIRTIWRDSRRWQVFRNLSAYKNPKCLSCPHYTVRCVGSCPIMGYYEAKRPEAFDPYCFVDILTKDP
jgi:radical SAM protein with 4Fe4S-binding SPASM domain